MIGMSVFLVILISFFFYLIHHLLTTYRNRKKYHELLKSPDRLVHLEQRVKDKLVRSGLITPDFNFILLKQDDPEVYGYTAPLGFVRRYSVIFVRTGKLRHIHYRTIFHEYIHTRLWWLHELQMYFGWFILILFVWYVSQYSVALCLILVIFVELANYAIDECIERFVIDRLEDRLVKRWHELVKQ